MPLIRNRCGAYLNEINYNKDFSINIVKNYLSCFIYMLYYI